MRAAAVPIRSVPANPTNKTSMARIRVATYNVHKCRGLDGRVRPQRIVEVLREIDADIVALQEVVCLETERPESHQGRYAAEALGLHAELGENRRHRGGAYGNVVLSRFPIREARNHDISVGGRERRGCLQADVRMAGNTCVRVFNLHLGTAHYERQIQARELMRQQMFSDRLPDCSRIVLGDFNEWSRSLASRMLGARFESAGASFRGRGAHTYPGFLPLLPLDHIYFDRGLRLERVAIHRSRAALVASDHLPLVAEFSLSSADAERTGAGLGDNSGPERELRA
jgi:endonuclease/exonuclease/phosphatase family metal-dependent hydrolase